MFLYFGHGNGMQYYHPHEISKAKNLKAGCMIIGCSSAHSRISGLLEPYM